MLVEALRCATLANEIFVLPDAANRADRRFALDALAPKAMPLGAAGTAGVPLTLPAHASTFSHSRRAISTASCFVMFVPAMDLSSTASSSLGMRTETPRGFGIGFCPRVSFAFWIMC
jgi:hypothetical protein